MENNNYCEKCGKKLNDGAQFCANCGATVGGTNYGENTYSSSGDKAYANPEITQPSNNGLKIGIIILAVFLLIGAITATLLIVNKKETPVTGEIASDSSTDIVASEAAVEEATKIDSDVVITPVDTTTYKTDKHIIPDSSSRYISANEISGMSSAQLRLARNEIYARHGRLFDDNALQEYFNECSWYEGYINPANFKESVFNEYEKANIQTLKQQENGGQSQSSTGSERNEPESCNAVLNEFYFPYSDCMYLSAADLRGYSKGELRYARNEIYARHGRMFKDEKLQNYFNNCSWYRGTIPADSFKDSMLNDYERANIKLIQEHE